MIYEYLQCDEAGNYLTHEVVELHQAIGTAPSIGEIIEHEEWGLIRRVASIPSVENGLKVHGFPRASHAVPKWSGKDQGLRHTPSGCPIFATKQDETNWLARNPDWARGDCSDPRFSDADIAKELHAIEKGSSGKRRRFGELAESRARKAPMEGGKLSRKQIEKIQHSVAKKRQRQRAVKITA